MDYVPLIEACRRCQGRGMVPGAELPESCPACSGKGVVLTEEGRSILGLLKLAEGVGGG
jgi:DnaJ-class molecular chaperone